MAILRIHTIQTPPGSPAGPRVHHRRDRREGHGSPFLSVGLQMGNLCVSIQKGCKVCGRDVSDDPGGVMNVYPDGHGTNKIEYLCAEHNPNPATTEQLAERERQDLEASIAALKSEVRLLRELMDLNRPVTPGDRFNIGMELLRMLDRFIGQENKLRAMEGKPPFPPRHTWDDLSEKPD